MFDIKKAQAEAEREIIEENAKAAKEKIKAKLKQRDAAKRIVLNIERELEDLYVELGESL